MSPRKLRNELNIHVAEYVATQKWPVLVIFHTASRGRGVKTSIPFAKGDVVCNFDAQVIMCSSADEHISNANDSSYML